MSDEHDDVTTGNGDGREAVDDAERARPSGKRSGGRRSRTALAEPPASGAGATVTAPGKSGTRVAKAAKPSRNPFASMWLFLRQVVAELRKVIWPTRPQMINYTIIVLIFVVVLTALVSLLDLGFAQLMLWAFG